MVEVIIGVDPHKASNTIAVLSRDETMLTRRRFDNSDDGFVEMLRRRSIALLVLVLGIVLVGAAAASRAATLPSEATAWSRVRTEHFTVYSSAPEAKRTISASSEALSTIMVKREDTLFTSMSLPTTPLGPEKAALEDDP